MRHVICDAVPFGYGPSAKVLSVAEAMGALGKKVKILTHKATNDFLQKSAKSVNERLGQALIKTTPFSDESLEDAAVLVSVMHETTLAMAQKRAIPTITVDSLFWMWAVPPAPFVASDLYIIQNDPRNAANLAQFKNDLGRSMIVGPILTSRRTAGHPTNDVLVSVGGVASPMSTTDENASYVALQARLIAAVARLQSNRNFIFCCPPQLHDIAETQLKLPNVSTLSPDHDAFLSLLSQVSAVMASPGLTTILESFAAGVPFISLLPQNYSQYFNARLVEGGPIDQFSLKAPNGSRIELGLPEAEGVAAVQKGLRMIDEARHAEAIISGKLVAALEATLSDRSAILAAQAVAFTRFGKSSSTIIADRIVSQFVID